MISHGASDGELCKQQVKAAKCTPIMLIHFSDGEHTVWVWLDDRLLSVQEQGVWPHHSYFTNARQMR
jgi:hypothetical protein